MRTICILWSFILKTSWIEKLVVEACLGLKRVTTKILTLIACNRKHLWGRAYISQHIFAWAPASLSIFLCVRASNVCLCVCEYVLILPKHLTLPYLLKQGHGLILASGIIANNCSSTAAWTLRTSSFSLAPSTDNNYQSIEQIEYGKGSHHHLSTI